VFFNFIASIGRLAFGLFRIVKYADFLELLCLVGSKFLYLRLNSEFGEKCGC
jgi:hypothetical protein